MRYTEKIAKKIESQVLRIVLMVLAAGTTGVFGGMINVGLIPNIFGPENELLSTIVQWSILGAISPFIMGIPFGKNKKQEN